MRPPRPSTGGQRIGPNSPGSRCDNAFLFQGSLLVGQGISYARRIIGVSTGTVDVCRVQQLSAPSVLATIHEAVPRRTPTLTKDDCMERLQRQIRKSRVGDSSLARITCTLQPSHPIAARPSLHSKSAGVECGQAGPTSIVQSTEKRVRHTQRREYEWVLPTTSDRAL